MADIVDVKNLTFVIDEAESLDFTLDEAEQLDFIVDDFQVIQTGDYNDLINKPQIESVTLIGNKTFKQLGIDTLSVQEIEKILYLD